MVLVVETSGSVVLVVVAVGSVVLVVDAVGSVVVVVAAIGQTSVTMPATSTVTVGDTQMPSTVPRTSPLSGQDPAFSNATSSFACALTIQA